MHDPKAEDCNAESFDLCLQSVLIAVMNVVMWESAAVKHPDGIPPTRNAVIDDILGVVSVRRSPA